jgi:hypothetical protein
MVVACAVGLAACNNSGEVDTADDRGWRVLADENGIGGEPRVYIATTNAEYHSVWAELGFATGQPSVDLDNEIVVVFTIWSRGDCSLPFKELELDHTARTISPRYISNEPGNCTAEEIPSSVAVAISRDVLTADIYDVRIRPWNSDLADETAIQLKRDD